MIEFDKTNGYTFQDVLNQYHLRAENLNSTHKVVLNQLETIIAIPNMNNLIMAKWKEQPTELTSKVEHEGNTYFVKADIEYYPTLEREIEESLDGVESNDTQRTSEKCLLLDNSKPSISNYNVMVKLIWR